MRGYDGGMTSTAKRRWSRELESEIDGIAFGPTGPVMLHGYDRPAGGKWHDHVIPGKLGAFDRNTGDALWIAPCEVGYGRGFGAALASDGTVIVLGPGTGGHRIVRMSLANGELIDGTEIAPFDEAHVSADLCLCVNAGRVFAIDPRAMKEVWEYKNEGERFHHIARSGNRALVVFSNRQTGKQGVCCLDVETGRLLGLVVPATQEVIHDVAATREAAVVLTTGIAEALSDEQRERFAAELAEAGPGNGRDTLSLLAMPLDREPREGALWYRVLETRRVEEPPDVSISADSGKLYLERGAYLEALDILTGRRLGEWTVPGLDVQIAWQVADGAGLLAEETRASVFELPA